MIKRLLVRNYKTLVDFNWELPPTCVLVGDNGSGKSSLVEILWLLQDVVARGKQIQETGFADNRTAWLDESAQKIEVDVDYEGIQFYYKFECLDDDGRLSLREDLSSNGQTLYRAGGGKVELFGDRPNGEPRTTLAFDRRRSFLAALEERDDNRKLATFRRWLDSIWAIKPDPRRFAVATKREAVWLERDLSNFADWYRGKSQEDPEASDLLRKDLCRALRGFVFLRLQPIATNVKELNAKFQFAKNSCDLSWGTLSDGQRLLIALYALRHYGLKNASMIVLDEIENYIAPSEIQPWLCSVADLAAEGDRQLLVVSHHPESIDYMSTDAVWKMRRNPISGCSEVSLLQPDLDSGETAYQALKLDAPEDAS